VRRVANLFWAVVLLVGGLVILWKSAELLVGGAVGLAKQLGVTPLVIGLTIVAMGTSAPEVAASIAAAARGAGDLAVGNVYGSNIANLALIGGLIALIRPIKTKKQTLQREMPAMLIVALLLFPVVYNLYLSRTEAAALLCLFAALILLTVYFARKEAAARKNNEKMDSRFRGNDNKEHGSTIVKNIVFCAVGLAGLAVGARMTVEGAIFIGERVGLSEAVIGLTIIAIGTSLPELATCIVAAIKGEHDISIGNLVGSNIFNTLLVTGTAGTVRPFSLAKRLAATDYWVMIAVSALFILLALIGRRIIGRVSGALLLCAYFGYIVYLLVFSAGA
jgi:cation:H+ antiporter